MKHQPIIMEFVSQREFESLHEKYHQAKNEGQAAVRRFIDEVMTDPPAITYYGVLFLGIAHCFLGEMKEAKRYESMIRNHYNDKRKEAQE